MKCPFRLLALLMLALAPELSSGQAGYEVVSVQDGGTIKGTVKRQGALPHLVASEINKDPQVCDPLGQKHRDLERLLIAPNGGVANTVVFLRNFTRGKAMDLPAPRRHLDQKNCRYEPHILLVPVQETLTVMDSDPLLHTVQMSGSADYNLPFVLAGQEITRPMTREGKVSLRCNVHVWMNGEMMVARHPYYAVTNQNGAFELTEIPPGDYETRRTKDELQSLLCSAMFLRWRILRNHGSLLRADFVEHHSPRGIQLLQQVEVQNVAR
jgi:hypothetical protein